MVQSSDTSRFDSFSPRLMGSGPVGAKNTELDFSRRGLGRGEGDSYFSAPLAEIVGSNPTGWKQCASLMGEDTNCYRTFPG